MEIGALMIVGAMVEEGVVKVMNGREDFVVRRKPPLLKNYA